MPPTQLAGVLAVVQTPFDSNEQLDIAALDNEVRWSLENGAHGLTIGMVSEILRLEMNERLALTEAVVASAGTRPVVANCSAESSHAAAAAAAAMEGLGAAALMAIPPTHVSVGDDAVIEYYASILDATSVPVVIQDASSYVGKPLSPEILVALRDRDGDRVLAKPEASPIGPNLSKLRDATGGLVPFYEGTGGVALVDSFRRGIAGTMPAVDLVWAVRAAWDALLADRDDVAYDVVAAMSGIIIMQTELDAYIAIEKYLLVRQGVLDDARQRGPVGYSLDRETLLEVDRLFDRLDETVRGSGFDPRLAQVAGQGTLAP